MQHVTLYVDIHISRKIDGQHMYAHISYIIYLMSYTIYIYIYIHVAYLYTCIHILNIYICIHIRIYIHIYVHIYRYICICICNTRLSEVRSLQEMSPFDPFVPVLRSSAKQEWPRANPTSSNTTQDQSNSSFSLRPLGGVWKCENGCI